MQVRIYKPTRSTMQSGEGGSMWLLEFINSNSKFKELLMGRTSSNDMMNEVKLEFFSCEEAVNFAKSKNYSYEIIKPKLPKLIKKSYASNFD